MIKDSASGEPLAGVTVFAHRSGISRQTNDAGLVQFSNLPDGENRFTLTYTGAIQKEVAFLLPDTTLHQIVLQREAAALDQVVISTTRTESNIERSPLKVEVLGREEMDEENTIKPGNIASILGDVSGVQIQQASPVSGNANVRIQGLEGRYTQILRDGMPLFEGFSGGFGVLTIPPLDLRQIELVKGSASTLFGGGAIGGLVNLISKRPMATQEAVLTLNQSTLKESNSNTYLAKRYHQFGYTFFGGITKQGATDVNGDGLSDVSRQETYFLHPRLFFYPSGKTTIVAGYNGTFSNNTGGDLAVLKGIKNAQHQFFETNRTRRNTGEILVEQVFVHGIKGSLKTSISNFDRSIETASHFFRGKQLNYFTEASVLIPKGSWNLVAGFNLTGDEFRKKPSDPVALQDFSNHTAGAFAQLTQHLGEATTLETGLRADHHQDYGTFVLPRIALFHRFNETWGSRAGFGMGYKTPNALAPQMVDYAVEALRPIGSQTKAETSYGLNAELNYRRPWGDDGSLFINQAFFLTRLQNPVVVNESSTGEVSFSNGSASVVSKGFDTYVQLKKGTWEVYAGYTFTIAERNYLPQNRFVPLTPKNRFAFTLVYEMEEAWRFGLEGSFTGRQHRMDYTLTPGYYFAAAMVERKFGRHLSLVLNGENLLNFRQSDHEALFSGPLTDPRFAALWAPIDGRVLNLALRWSK